MAKLYGREFSQIELMKRIGDISQIAGVKHYKLINGNEEGVEAVDFRTGTGFSFTVLPGRGTDISSAEYCGQPLCWRSSTGNVAAEYYEPTGLGWLRGFYGGLLTTCGMTYVGDPSFDPVSGEMLGLHGRMSYIPAKNVLVDGDWDDDDYIMWVQGKVRETVSLGVDILLKRKIWAKLGESKLYINDMVKNIGFDRSPHMILYHINGGYPSVDENSRLVLSSKKVIPRDKNAEAGLDAYDRFQAPTAGFEEQVYYHEMSVDEDGYAYAALINRNFKNGQGFGFYVKYAKATLPIFVQWKMNAVGSYVVGMEPANCHVEGREKEKEYGTLQYLEPGEKREYELEIGVLSSVLEIDTFESRMKKILSE